MTKKIKIRFFQPSGNLEDDNAYNSVEKFGTLVLFSVLFHFKLVLMYRIVYPNYTFSKFFYYYIFYGSHFFHVQHIAKGWY